MNHFKAVPHMPNHDLRQLRRVVWSIVSNAADRSSKTNAVGSPSEGERWISFLIYSRAILRGVTTFVCRFPRIIKIITIDKLHELSDNYPLQHFDMKHSPDTSR